MGVTTMRTKRLIDANALKDLRDKYIRGEIHFDDEYDLVDRCPTVDAEVVVRCKDCKHYDMGVCLKIYSDGNVHSAAWQRRKPDDFCSYGEQRDKPGCPRGQCGPLASCPICGGFDTVWDPNTDESFCKSCGFSTRWM